VCPHSELQGDRLPRVRALWYAALGVLARCENGDAIAHEWSAKDPRYDRGETQGKLDYARPNTTGASLCERFAGLGTKYKAVCEACPHFGEIKSPISLGYPSPEQQAQEALDKKNAAAIEELADAKERLKGLLEETLKDPRAPMKQAAKANIITLRIGDSDAYEDLIGELSKLKDENGKSVFRDLTRLKKEVDDACRDLRKQQKTKRKNTAPCDSKPSILVEECNPHRTVAALIDALSQAGVLYDRGMPFGWYTTRYLRSTPPMRSPPPMSCFWHINSLTRMS